MPFFLLGKNADDELRLLTPAVWDTRQAAMAELSRITADPTFDEWDSEVFVVDLDSGVPVLLVRPNADVEPVEAEEAAEAVEDESLVESEDEGPAEAGVDEVEVEAAEADQVAEPELAADEEADTADEVEEIIVTEEVEAEVEETADETEAVVVEEPEPVVVEEIVIEDISAEAPEEEPNDLRDALLRTTEQMEASGIVAPESVGPAEDAIVAEAPETVAVEGETAEAPAWPWDNPEPGPAVPSPPADVAFVLDALEEPAADDRSILPTSLDDETFAAAKPVILGAYGESDSPQEAAQSAPADEIDVSDFALPSEPMSIDEVEIVPATLDDTPMYAPEPPVEAPTEDLSDFILDLETVTTVPEVVVEAPAAAPAAVEESPLGEYTCSDCVYEETCPNRDQRLPKDCISFQWK